MRPVWMQQKVCAPTPRVNNLFPDHRCIMCTTCNRKSRARILARLSSTEYREARLLYLILLKKRPFYETEQCSLVSASTLLRICPFGRRVSQEMGFHVPTILVLRLSCC